MINIGWDEVYNGEEVVLLGVQGNNEVSVDDRQIGHRQIPMRSSHPLT